MAQASTTLRIQLGANLSRRESTVFRASCSHYDSAVKMTASDSGIDSGLGARGPPPAPAARALRCNTVAGNGDANPAPSAQRPAPSASILSLHRPVPRTGRSVGGILNSLLVSGACSGVAAAVAAAQAQAQALPGSPGSLRLGQRLYYAVRRGGGRLQPAARSFLGSGEFLVGTERPSSPPLL